MKQQTLAAFEQYGKPTRRAKFLADREQILPWAATALHHGLTGVTRDSADGMSRSASRSATIQSI
jgi:hypothetical protein